MNIADARPISCRAIVVVSVLILAPVQSTYGQVLPAEPVSSLNGVTLWQQATADKETIYSEEPDGFRLTDYRSPVPKTLSGAVTLKTEDLEALLAQNHATPPLLIDVMPGQKKPDWWPENQVWLPEPHLTIPTAYWLPEVGFGTINVLIESTYKAFLEDITQHNLDFPIVLFCRENCWISWNAAKRLVQYGYRKVHWYPDGLDGWLENLNDTELAIPEKF